MRVIGGSARGTLLKTRKGKGTRPTSGKVRGALFNILGPGLADAFVLDLFAGSGALGIEALSRGAVLACFVERDARTSDVIKDNLEKTGLTPRARILTMDVLRALRVLAGEKLSFDHIFMDPPYSYQGVDGVLAAIDNSGLLKRRGTIIVEHAMNSTTGTGCSFEIVKERSYGGTTLTFLEWKDHGQGEMV